VLAVPGVAGGLSVARSSRLAAPTLRLAGHGKQVTCLAFAPQKREGQETEIARWV
jgi:hypothetical protein